MSNNKYSVISVILSSSSTRIYIQVLGVNQVNLAICTVKVCKIISVILVNLLKSEMVYHGNNAHTTV